MRPRCHGRRACADDISIHAPVKGATTKPTNLFAYIVNFNPRTREGCDNEQLYWLADSGVKISIHAPVKGATVNEAGKMRCQLAISIHAPVKGATDSRFVYAADALISIHAPVKGATEVYIYNRNAARHFNPRTREGCDTSLSGLSISKSGISIHAPVKGATVKIAPFTAYRSDFNPRTREGCDINDFLTQAPIILFQSTHP